MSSLLRVSKLFLLSFFILYVTLVDAAPMADRLFTRDAGNASTPDFQKQNGLDAQKLNAQFASLSASDPCQAGSMACVNTSFAQCISGKWALTPCPSGLQCYALPLVKSPGTSLACDTQTDALARIAASGVSGGLTGSGTTSPSNTPTNSTATDPNDDSDCTDGDMTSSTKAMATPTPSSGGKQLYRRQTLTGSSSRAGVKNGKPGQAFPVTASSLPTVSALANSTSSVQPTLSATANTNSTPTQTPLSTATPTNQANVTTVTLIMVSTVTVTPSGCQTGVVTGLPSGSPTPLPSNSPAPTFTLFPSNTLPSGIPTTSSLAATLSPSPSSNSASSPPIPNVPSTLTPSSNSPTISTNTNTNTETPLATPSGANSTPSQGGIAFSTQDNFVAWPTPA